MGLINRAVSAAKRHGIRYTIMEAIPHLHRHYLRHHLPRRPIKLNGVRTHQKRLFDEIVPYPLGHPNPSEYEAALVAGLRDRVEPGDTTLIVGGGWGVTAVVAAEESAPDGQVHVYEASEEYAEHVRETAALNDAEDRIDVTNAVVSRAISVLGDSTAETVIPPSELPSCDILELDCEGAELDILKDLSIEPRVILVETHGKYESPTEEVADCLNSHSYTVVDDRVAETGPMAESCRENDIRVLIAVQDEQH